MTEFVSAVPIIPARGIEASASWYRDRLGSDAFHTGPEYGGVIDNNFNGLTSFEVPS